MPATHTRSFLLCTCLWAAGADAATCTEPASDAPIPDIRLEEVASGLSNPVYVTGAGDGSGKLYVVEQRGTVRVIDNGKLVPDPFLDIRAKVESGGEKGLLSIAFHPKYAENGAFFVDYTTREGGLYTHVSRMTRGRDGRADPRSEQLLLKIEQPYSNHNGGQLAFGPDGYLYIGLGDGGSANDPHEHGQNPKTLLGTVLRIDVDRPDGPRPYAIPRDNPFADKAEARPEIYAYGLRNPWRFSFDAANGRLYAADVGQWAREEIDVIEKGANYGWRIMEGEICTPSVNPDCNKEGLALPIQTYQTGPLGRSITGGFVYRGNRSPALCGVYLYGDYVSGNVWGLRYDGTRVTSHRQLLRTQIGISTFGQDDARELYVADHKSGRIFRIAAR
jgi:glucose/arabinose dehydrogenase